MTLLFLFRYAILSVVLGLLPIFVRSRRGSPEGVPEREDEDMPGGEAHIVINGYYISISAYLIGILRLMDPIILR